jgi:putative transposase
MSASATRTESSPFRGYRFPPEIIAQAVWLYFRFHLSFRDVQDLLAKRGVVVSHEAIRQWCATFGPAFASGLRRRRARPGDKWHLDEVLLKINGKRHWLWRAVDQNGVVLDILVQQRRVQNAAECFLRQVVMVLATNRASSSPISWRATHRRFDGCYPSPSIDARSV